MHKSSNRFLQAIAFILRALPSGYFRETLQTVYFRVSHSIHDIKGNFSKGEDKNTSILLNLRSFVICSQYQKSKGSISSSLFCFLFLLNISYFTHCSRQLHICTFQKNLHDKLINLVHLLVNSDDVCKM